MNLRKEPLVFVATVAIVGLVAYSNLGSSARNAPAKRATKPDLIAQPVPDVELTRPQSRDLGRIDRDLFSPPRDTHPLPLLDIDAPPLAPLSGVFPPPMPGPSPAQFGRLLRADATPTPVAGLFATDVESAGAFAGDEITDVTQAADPRTESVASAQDALTAEQRAAQMAGFKRLYDWMRLDDGAPRFGRIRNADKFGLRQRREEPVKFVELDPLTGAERFPGQEPIPFERGRVTEFHFAETTANRILERRREFGDSVTSGQYTAVMAFADQCVASRGEAREALDVARQMYALADTVGALDPAPRLGLARCAELSFDFETAFAELEALREKHAHRPEVHVRLGELEARVRLFESAERRFEEALRLARSNFEAQFAYGRFLMARGRAVEALEHLELAHQFEPPAEFLEQRLSARLELGGARLANGKLDGADGARAMFDSAVSIAPGDSRALAGRIAVEVCRRGNVPAEWVLGKDQAEFEMLLATGLARMQSKQWVEARDALLAAADADPLRAHGAWRALSWLAEVTGYPAEALRFVELSLEAAPDDAWSLYQHGRLLAQRDDPRGAERDFRAALDRELGFTDAIAALAVIAVDGGRFADADLYFGRALELDPKRAELESRRGFNHLALGDGARAEEAFKRAQALDANEPGARAGLAWCAYRRNDPGRAVELLRGLDDARRALSDKDEWRLFSRAQIRRIDDHVAKEAWEESFDRTTGPSGNRWSIEEAAGPTFSIRDGELVLQGNFKQTDGRARAFRTYPAGEFVSIELDVSVAARTFARVGMFVAKEKQQRDATAVLSQISIERHPEGGLQVLLMDRATTEPERVDVPNVDGEAWWPADKRVRLRIERLGDGSDSTGRISIDGIPVVEGFSMRTIAATGDVRVGLFAMGDNGQPVELSIDDVEVVYRRGR